MPRLMRKTHAEGRERTAPGPIHLHFPVKVSASKIPDIPLNALPIHTLFTFSFLATTISPSNLIILGKHPHLPRPDVDLLTLLQVQMLEDVPGQFRFDK